MEYLSGVWAAIAPAVGNHLWQSTLFAAVAAMMTLAVRKNHARVRYRLWVAASIKFLIPFSLLITLGGHLARPHNSANVQSNLYSVAQEIGQPFAGITAPSVVPVARAASADLRPLLQQALLAVWLCGFVAVISLWWWRWRRFSRAMQGAVTVTQGREVDALRRLEQIAGVRRPIALVLSQASLEPGILGIVRPALIWPVGISAQLTDAHLEAIIAHEVWHVRRRDNLAAAMHMVVEAIFWFHPLVWWLGARLVEERERACDEEVLRLGNPPQVYAESILKTCEFCVGSLPVSVSGVTGADLKSRIVRIMTERVARELDFGKKLLFVAAALLTVAAPIVFGLQNTTPSPAAPEAKSTAADTHGYDVASIKPNKSGDNMVRMMIRPDGLSATGTTLQMLIQNAYEIQDFQIVGAPKWVSSDRYDIQAKMDSAQMEKLKALSPDESRLESKRMLQALLANRFQLVVHREKKELPGYALVIAKGGSKLHEAKPGDTYPNGIKGPDGQPGTGLMIMGGNGGPVTGQGISVENLTRLLSQQLGRTILDETGLKGNYDFTLQWTPDERAGPMPGAPQGGGPRSDDAPPPDSSGASIFTAIQEQLGLKLESRKVPVEMLVIDHVEAPSEN
jgi:bla regulator protein BlaR1